MGIKVNDYTDEFKEAVAKLVISKEIGYAEAMRRFNIGGKMTIYRWISKFESERPIKLFMEESEGKKIEELRLEIERLKSELDYERLKSEAYNAMIKIAEEEFRIPIRKKSGAKQSKK